MHQPYIRELYTPLIREAANLARSGLDRILIEGFPLEEIIINMTIAAMIARING